jgi:chitodextrinase
MIKKDMFALGKLFAKSFLTAKNDAHYSEWDIKNTYNKNDRAVHGNKIWESLIDNNTSEPGTGNWDMVI